MKTTVKALVGWIALTLVCSASTGMAGLSTRAAQTGVVAAMLGQSSGANDSSTTTAGKNEQAADLLRRARQAMTENDLPAADALIQKAESLGVTYSTFHMGDTPKKARRDLERKHANGAGMVAKPSQLFSPLDLNKNRTTAPGNDPFAGRTTAADSPDAGVRPLPNVNGVTPNTAMPGQRGMATASDEPYPIQPGENEAQSPGATAKNAAKNAGPNLLCAARLALAVGDVRHALELVRQAQSTRANYHPAEDTPDKVEAAIRKYQEVLALDKNTEAHARAYARSLTEQADALARWGEYDEAERLAGRAAGMRLTYGPFEQKPQEVLERIISARRQERRPAQGGPASQESPVASRQRALELVRQAREAMASGHIDQAEMLARHAASLPLPNGAFAPGEDCPQLVLLDLQQLRKRDSGVVTASAQQVVPAGGPAQMNREATRALYDSANDFTRTMAASSQQRASGADVRIAQNAPPRQPPQPPAPNDPSAAATPGMALFQQGEAALRARDTAKAYEFFRQAANHPNDLDPITAQRLQDHLQLLAAPAQPKPPAGQTPSLADEAAARQQILARQVAAELAHRESNARTLRENDPKGALAMLEDAKKKVETAPLDSAARDQLLRRVDRAIGETKQFIEQRGPQIALAESNNRTRQDIQREQRTKVEVQEKLARLIDDFNRLMDEQRYEEAGIKAKQAAELDPDNPVVVQVLWQHKFVTRFRQNQNVENAQEEGFMAALGEVDSAAIPFAGDKNPMVFGDVKDWSKLTKSRLRFAGDRRRARSEREIEIEKKLRTPVSLQFTNAPLSKVMDYLAKLAEVNLHLDPKGLAEEGVTTDTPVTIELRNEIMLKSALHLILEPLHLSYVIKDEVLKITSEQMRDGQVYTVTYNVADLVVPIPNFVPTPSMGLAGAYQGAMANVGFGGTGAPFGSSTTTPLAVVANNSGKGNSGAALNPAVLAQMNTGGLGTAGQKGGASVGAGPGGLGGGAQPDFDSLIELITSTIKPTTWDSVGGPGSIAPFETNLSMVVSQTQDVHEEIVDLLGQLRRLQDLQVTIEVRFITLNDNFFERIGVSFDFAINDNIDNTNVAFGARDPAQGITYAQPSQFTTGQGVNRNIVNQDSNRTVSVGLSAPNMFSADLDIPFTQNSFGLAVPQFGGFDATAGAQLGFAILSDIEAYFFINAAQGDKRSNVLQAPKVTLFNGQQAFVSDTSQSPFVISVVPVVGDFAAAQQPVIVVLSEGTFMTVQAVISNDRRFVRLTVVPFFSKIGEVDTFQFTGSTTTTVDTTREGLQAAATDPSKLWNKKGDNVATTNTGTTVQLPTFSFVTVTTTVSVPDGGTVLLGGIKRLSEGRNEAGVPMLNKLPYINRLFKNVAIGRETQSLMMMVTPRIIIQEEEEEKMGIQTTP